MYALPEQMSPLDTHTLFTVRAPPPAKTLISQLLNVKLPGKSHFSQFQCTLAYVKQMKLKGLLIENGVMNPCSTWAGVLDSQVDFQVNC